ncbi:phage tail protein [Microcoleus sp. N9_A1]|uniref:phage tail protein n=1 Tax=Microcoleus sp. N9_A1 TaxID=3055380 RepID=UPI002FCED0C6
MTNFGLITEGLTDQIVIESILAGYFNNPDLDIRPLQPERDKDDDNKSHNYGGWSQVIAYCESTDFKEAFQFIEYIIIQIDTDVSEDYNIPKQDENGELTPQQLIEKVIDKFKGLIGEDFYRKYEQRIVFAISVHSIECWLLPLYYTDKRKSKLINCLDTLNQQLSRKDSFTIDRNAKNPDYYRQIARKYCKQKVLRASYPDNPSFKVFIEELENRNIAVEPEDDF